MYASLYLRAARRRVTDADDHSIAHHVLDVAGRFRPLGGNRDEADVTFGCILPPLEFLDIRLADPAERMGAARAIFGRYGRTLDVETFDRTAFR